MELKSKEFNGKEEKILMVDNGSTISSSITSQTDHIKEELNGEIKESNQQIMRKLRSHSNDFKSLKRKTAAMNTKLEEFPDKVDQLQQKSMETLEKNYLAIMCGQDKMESKIIAFMTDIDQTIFRLKGLMIANVFVDVFFIILILIYFCFLSVGV